MKVTLWFDTDETRPSYMIRVRLEATDEKERTIGGWAESMPSRLFKVARVIRAVRRAVKAEFG